ncbi:efflux RND transporter periplasmic adaptor subunit [Lacibacterium aquatile]|uniref:Efflux RND transporter periplasmic adaptor subunit n=1 Tax=Lacibacterium aquatile TaxID=1168082 RepID=A0ABW5DTJ9_9PROT
MKYLPFVLVLATLPVAAQEAKVEAGPKPPAVSAVLAARQTLTERVSVTGTVVPREEILVAPEVDGLRIAEILVEEGDRVTKGQVLARLSRETLATQVAQSDGARSRAVAAIAQSRSQIAEADAALTEANAALKRAQALRTTGAGSQEQLDQRTAAARTASARLASARDGLRASEASLTEIDAQGREQRIRFGQAEVKAPADGIISRRNAKLGGLASSAADPMFSIIENGALDLAAEVPEQRYARLAIGQKAELTLPDGSAATGTIRLIAPRVDPVTRLGLVRIALASETKAASGNFMRGAIITNQRETLAIPASAVLFTNGGKSIQIIENDRIVTKPIVTGLVDGASIEVQEGIAAGAAVVARSGSFLRQGDVVRPVIGGKE